MSYNTDLLEVHRKIIIENLHVHACFFLPARHVQHTQMVLWLLCNFCLSGHCNVGRVSDGNYKQLARSSLLVLLASSVKEEESLYYQNQLYNSP